MVLRRIIQWLDPADPKRLEASQRLCREFGEEHGDALAALQQIREQDPDHFNQDKHAVAALECCEKAKATLAKEVELWEVRQQFWVPARIPEL